MHAPAPTHSGAPPRPLEETVDLLQAIGEPTRLRLLSALREAELSVQELVRIVEASQSRVSSHLGRLRESGLVVDRRDGNSAYYSLPTALRRQDGPLAWALSTSDDPVLRADRERARAVVRERERGSIWPDRMAGQLDKHYSPGRTWESAARALAAVARLGDVLDVGGGDGAIARILAPSAKRITLLDRSEPMLAAARARLQDAPNARVVHGDMHEMPFGDASFDEVLALNVLGYTSEPERVIEECTRVLRPGGRLVVVALAPHAHRDTVASYGHVSLGIAPANLARAMEDAGLSVVSSAITSREKRAPRFEVVQATADKPATSPVPRQRTRTQR